MQRTLSGHPGFSRRVCALLLSSATLLGMMLIGLKPASATIVDDGRVKLPIIYDTTLCRRCRALPADKRSRRQER